MSEITIQNFVGQSPVRVTACATETCGDLVMIIQRWGAMSFQHSMMPAQARDMAAALVQMADSFEVSA